MDIETLRQPRAAKFAAALSEFTHESWLTADAEVVECRRVRLHRYYSPSMDHDAPILLRGYVVTFSYIIGGRTYTGVLNSPVEVEPHDRFDIRYNPANPQENNSLGSSGGLLPIYLIAAGLVLAILLLLYLNQRFFSH